jgi:hypothetical protein
MDASETLADAELTREEDFAQSAADAAFAAADVQAVEAGVIEAEVIEADTLAPEASEGDTTETIEFTSAAEPEVVDAPVSAVNACRVVGSSRRHRREACASVRRRPGCSMYSARMRSTRVLNVGATPRGSVGRGSMVERAGRAIRCPDYACTMTPSSRPIDLSATPCPREKAEPF